MKVILQRDVAKLGKRSSVVVVPDGYALNKLIPQGLAVPATPANLKRVTATAIAHDAHEQTLETSLMAGVAHFAATPLTITVEANAQGHLFKAIKASDIAAAATAHGHTIPESVMSITKPIKSVGAVSVTISHGAYRGELALMIAAK